MLYPVVPIFLTQVLKNPASIVGIVEGIATATQYITQGFSSTWPQVVGARFLDRLGVGTRSAPRDALIAFSASEANK